jgi:glycosyltransferase involved in cell wall biosynthesis
MTAVLEMATGHVPAAERILGRERERNPEWADSLSNAGFPAWYARRLDDEPRRADFCIAASSFTRATLTEAGIDDHRIRTLPLGADLSAFTFARRKPTGPFRVLFVGGVGQRKGISYLLDAYERIRTRNTRLTVVGPMIGSGRAFRARSRHVDYVGRVDTRTVVDHMHRSHVLVLPSLFEGFGLVITEAMATGMPVIASTHSAGPDIIREGIDGHVLPPDDVEGLAARLNGLAEDRIRAVEMGVSAAQRASEYGWENHTLRLLELCEVIADHHHRTDPIVVEHGTREGEIGHGHGKSSGCLTHPIQSAIP